MSEYTYLVSPDFDPTVVPEGYIWDETAFKELVKATDKATADQTIYTYGGAQGDTDTFYENAADLTISNQKYNGGGAVVDTTVTADTFNNTGAVTTDGAIVFTVQSFSNSGTFGLDKNASLTAAGAVTNTVDGTITLNPGSTLQGATVGNAGTITVVSDHAAINGAITNNGYIDAARKKLTVIGDIRNANEHDTMEERDNSVITAREFEVTGNLLNYGVIGTEMQPDHNIDISGELRNYRQVEVGILTAGSIYSDGIYTGVKERRTRGYIIAGQVNAGSIDNVSGIIQTASPKETAVGFNVTGTISNGNADNALAKINAGINGWIQAGALSNTGTDVENSIIIAGKITVGDIVNNGGISTRIVEATGTITNNDTGLISVSYIDESIVTGMHEAASITAAKIINGGTFTVYSEAALPTTVSVTTIENNGTFKFSGAGTTLTGDVVNNATCRIDIDGTVTVVGTITNTETGIIKNAGSFTANGGCAFAGTIENTGSFTVSGANTFTGTIDNNGVFTVALANAGDPAVMNGWSSISGGKVVISVSGAALGAEYSVATGVGTWSGDVVLTVDAVDMGNFFAIENGAVDPDYSQIVYQARIYNLAVADDAMKLEVGDDEVATLSPGGSIVTGGTLINNGKDRAAKWVGGTVTSGAVIHIVGDGESTRNAWLGIEGTDLSGATIYGAAAGGTVDKVDLWITSGAVIGNLAAGAAATGTVGSAVNLMIDDATVEGNIYAGGLGTVGTSSGGVVVGEVRTLINGGTFMKDFYAGALANYAKTEVWTDVGDVTLTVTGGTFEGNIYGASAVKVDEDETGGTAVHTAGKINVTVTGGEATERTEEEDAFCLFGGGYATGANSELVYVTDAVTIDISGGNWGAEKGGRGIFGGAFAGGNKQIDNEWAGVAASIGDVNITISGGMMGNVYGGGWAQRLAFSEVGNVNITITGGTVANVFGGGSHSTSGGTTAAGNVTITVSGGTISGDIYAKGQLEGDSTGTAAVIFTGNTDYSCGVYGYSYVGGEASDATLRFTDYTGTFEGAIGGFDPGITFGGNTAMTLATAVGKSVSNAAWEFDLTDRAEALAGTSLLSWSTANFENDTIKVSFADETQAKGGWNIAAVAEAFSGTTFDVEVGGDVIASGLAYNGQIATGDYQGWGFTLEKSALKFKQLA